MYCEYYKLKTPIWNNQVKKPYVRRESKAKQRKAKFPKEKTLYSNWILDFKFTQIFFNKRSLVFEYAY